MTIQIGDTIPDVTFTTMTEDGPEPIGKDFFDGKTVALFAVPGAFTPTCSAKHLPGFLDKAADLKAKGVDAIVCTSVNDVFVMGAWAKANDAEGVTMLADGNGDFAEAVGPDDGRLQVRHGQAQPALFDADRERRREAAQRRGARASSR